MQSNKIIITPQDKDLLIGYLKQKTSLNENESQLKNILNKNGQIEISLELSELLFNVTETDNFQDYLQTCDLTPNNDLDAFQNLLDHNYSCELSKQFNNAFMLWIKNDESLQNLDTQHKQTLIAEIFHEVEQLNESLKLFLSADQKILHSSKSLVKSQPDLLSRVETWIDCFKTYDFTPIQRNSGNIGLCGNLFMLRSDIEKWCKNYKLVESIELLQPERKKEILKILKVTSLEKLIEDSITQDDVYKIISEQEKHYSDESLSNKSFVEIYLLEKAKEEKELQEKIANFLKQHEEKSWTDIFINQQENDLHKSQKI